MVKIQLPKLMYNVLIEFAHIHLDFQQSELESVLGIYGLWPIQDYQVIQLPTLNNSDNTILRHRPFMILSFSLDQRNKFCIPRDDKHDIIQESLIDRYSKSTSDLPPTLASILSQCTLVRSAIELWGAGTSFEECAASVQNQIFTDNEKGNHNMGIIYNRLDKIFTENHSWKITIQTLGRTCTRENHEEMRNYFRFLKLPGPVIMNHPDHEFIIIREIELENSGPPATPRFHHHNNNSNSKQLMQEYIQQPPLAVYFGRILGHHRNYRTGIEKFTLKKRIYLGPTSMDAELSFIMTSLAQVKRGSFCFDPFVGTGSLLLTCAMKGAGMCLGTDIDIRVLRGKNDESIYKNFEQYNLSRPELIRSDNSIFHRHYKSMHSVFDAIVTDPPYGIRAGARKSGSRLDHPRPVPDSDRCTHIAQTKPYIVSDVMADLLDVAARALVLGGRLVYIMPSMRDFNPDTDLPRHDCLNLVHVCFQSLQIEFGRRVVTMVKTKDYDESKRSHYVANVWLHGTVSAEKCANIRERLITLSKEKANSAERSLSRKQRRLIARDKYNGPLKRSADTIEKVGT